MVDVKDRPAGGDDAELILKLQENLDLLKNQVHTWTAKSKGKILTIHGKFPIHSGTTELGVLEVLLHPQIISIGALIIAPPTFLWVQYRLASPIFHTFRRP